jgi:hypothetical protein
MMEDLINEELLKGETILWKGRPNPNVLFTSSDIFLVPFSLLWGGFAIFWEASVLGIGVLSRKSAPSAIIIPFALFGIPFVVAGIYFIFGRFIYKKKKKLKTIYAVTNKRILAITNMFRKNIQVEYIDRIPTINISERSDRNGTIKFGNSNFMTGMYDNTGMDFFSGFYGKNTLAFYDIDNAKEVYKKVNDLRNQLSDKK